MNSKIKKMVTAAMLAALTCIMTMIIKIPSPLKGYINLGDGTVLLSGWVLPPFYGFLSAAIGSALADIFSGYILYAPATFIIKGLMALAAYCLYKFTYRKFKSMPSRIISAAAAEIIMCLGYLIFEGFMYGFGASLVNIPANIIQGAAGMIVGIIAIRAIDRKAD